MSRRHLQDVLYVAATGLSRSNCVDAVSECDFSRRFSKFDYHFNFGIKSVHMKWLVILRIGDKSYSVETYRAHIDKIPR